MIDAAFLGSLVGDAEMKSVKNGKAYVRFRVAVGGGDDTQFVGACCFGDSALKRAHGPRRSTRVFMSRGRLEARPLDPARTVPAAGTA